MHNRKWVKRKVLENRGTLKKFYGNKIENHRIMKLGNVSLSTPQSTIRKFLVIVHKSHCVQTCPVQFSCSVMSYSLQPHELQHTRLSCPSPTPGAYSNSCPLSWWCHSSISSSIVPFSSGLQTFPASRSFPRSQYFASGGQSTRASASASVLPMNIQDWFTLE